MTISATINRIEFNKVLNRAKRQTLKKHDFYQYVKIEFNGRMRVISENTENQIFETVSDSRYEGQSEFFIHPDSIKPLIPKKGKYFSIEFDSNENELRINGCTCSAPTMISKQSVEKKLDGVGNVESSRVQFVENFEKAYQRGNLKKAISLSGFQLLRMLESVYCALEKDSNRRFALNGICFEFAEYDSEELLNLIATDGRRLHFSQSSKKGNHNRPCESESGIVPAHACKQLIDTLKTKKESEVIIQLFENSIKFLICSDSTSIESRIIEGRFPNYFDVMQSANKTDCVHLFDKKEIEQLQGFLSQIVGFKDEIRGIDFRISRENVFGVYDNPNYGKPKYGKPEKMEQLLVTYDCLFLSEIFKSFPDSVFDFHVNSDEIGTGKSSSSAGFFRAQCEKIDVSFQAVLMPYG